MSLHKIVTTVFALLAVSATGWAGEKMHPVSIEDVMKFRIITGMELAQSGGVLLKIQDFGTDESFKRDLYWLTPGSPLKQLTFSGAMSGDFSLSSGGTEVVYYADKQGKKGLYVLPLTGGESRLVLETAIPVSSIRWVGTKIYFSASVFPDCGTDFACTKKRLDDKDALTSAMSYTDLYVRPWSSWWDGTRQNLFSYDLNSGTVQTVAGGDFDVPTVPFGGVEDYVISHDGKAVCYTAKKVAKKYLSTNDDLFEIVDGKVKQITTNPASDRAPQYSPDGRFIAYLSQDIPGFESDRTRLKVYDRKTGENASLTESLDDWVLEFVWQADSSGLIATVAREGRRVLFKVPLDKRSSIVQIAERGLYRHLAISKDGRSLYSTRESMVKPPDVFVMDLATGKSEKLTSLNDDALSQILMPEVEEIRWDGALISDGRRQRVHGFLARPVDASGKVIKQKVPLVVMVHGGPQGAWEDSMHPRWTPLGVVGSGYAVAMPNPTGSSGYGQEFVGNVSRDWGGRPYEDIMTMVEHLSRDSAIDGTRVCAMGGSYGGYMANWMEAKSGTRFKCLISHAGPADLNIMYGTTDELWFPEWEMGGTPWDVPDMVKKWSPLSYVTDFRTPMLIMHGANDFRVPLEQALGMFTALKRRDIEAKLVVFPDESHFVNTPKNRRFWYRTVNEWLDAHLKK